MYQGCERLHQFEFLNLASTSEIMHILQRDRTKANTLFLLFFAVPFPSPHTSPRTLNACRCSTCTPRASNGQSTRINWTLDAGFERCV